MVRCPAGGGIGSRPVASARSRYLPIRRRWSGCPDVSAGSAARGAISWSFANALPSSSRPRSLRFARWAACETGLVVCVGSGRERRVGLDTGDLARPGIGRGAGSAACGSGRLEHFCTVFARVPQDNGRATGSTRPRPSSAHRRAKLCRERQRGRRSPRLPGRRASLLRRLATPHDSIKRHDVRDAKGSKGCHGEALLPRWRPPPTKEEERH